MFQVCQSVTYEGDNVTKLLNAIFNLRYLAILAIVAPFFGAALMFLLGTLDTVNAYRIFFGQIEPEGAIEAGEAAMVKLVASVDHFLFASILIIFAVGLYALFFRTSAGSEGQSSHKKRLSWSQLKNLGGMDEMLLKVIIMLLAVAFLEFMLTSGMSTLSWTVLVVPLTIIALAISLKWMQAGAEEIDLLAEQPGSSPAKEAYLDELERLSDLFDQGVITEEEFAARKKQILNT
jgi:uncharacterized membrane protein YqhA